MGVEDMGALILLERHRKDRHRHDQELRAENATRSIVFFPDLRPECCVASQAIGAPDGAARGLKKIEAGPHGSV